MLESIQIRNLVLNLSRTLAQRDKLSFSDPPADIACAVELEGLVLGNNAARNMLSLVHLHEHFPCKVLDENVIGNHLVCELDHHKLKILVIIDRVNGLTERVRTLPRGIDVNLLSITACHQQVKCGLLAGLLFIASHTEDLRCLGLPENLKKELCYVYRDVSWFRLLYI